MSVYLTIAEFKALALPPRAYRDVDDADLQVKLDHYEAIVNSYIARRYILPLTSFGGGVRQAVVNIGAYEMLKWRGVNATDGANSTVKDDYLKTLSDLEALASRQDPLCFGDIVATELPTQYVVSDVKQPSAGPYSNVALGDYGFDCKSIYGD